MAAGLTLGGPRDPPPTGRGTARLALAMALAGVRPVAIASPSPRGWGEWVGWLCVWGGIALPKDDPHYDPMSFFVRVIFGLKFDDF